MYTAVPVVVSGLWESYTNLESGFHGGQLSVHLADEAVAHQWLKLLTASGFAGLSLEPVNIAGFSVGTSHDT